MLLLWNVLLLLFHWFILLCVCTYVHVCARVHRHTHTHVGQRSKLGVDWNHFHLILTQDLWLIWIPRIWLGWLGQEASGMLLTPPPHCRHYRYVLPHVLWMWVLETQILVFILVWQSVNWLCLLPSPSYLLKSFHGTSQKQSPPSSLNSNAIYDNRISTT